MASVAKIVKFSDFNFLARGITCFFNSSPPTEIKTLPPSTGISISVASKAFIKASGKSSPMQPTSPVLAISTPNTGSALSSLINENIGALTPTYSP